MSSLFEEVPAAPPSDIPVRRITVTVNGEPHTADVEHTRPVLHAPDSGGHIYKRL